MYNIKNNGITPLFIFQNVSIFIIIYKMDCVLPPRYLRAANFLNKTGIDANIDVTFESGAK